jgi:hypothetical protein
MVRPRQLPDLIAGPMVRRATPDEVCFWLIMTRKLEKPQLRLFDFVEMEIACETGGTEPVRIGEYLYLYLLRAIPAAGEFLPHDEIIFYDIGEGLAGIEGGFLSILDEIIEQITVEEHKLPSFVLQAGGENRLRALYGSCRKLHGPGRDMTLRAEELIRENYEDLQARPRAIFLGGDQIYADDVSPRLIREINRLGRLLIGPGNSENEHIVGIGDRQPRLARLGFTSTEMHHHLKSIGEFFATYLLAWNGNLWDLISLKVNMRPNVEEAGREGAHAARFLFANCISYMIFDDHEITDDWNFDPKWEKYVYRFKNYANPDTKAASGGGELANIIANGLAAFWVFQAYGNNPDDYSAHFKRIISDYAWKGLNVPAFRKSLLGFHHWSFIAPTSPPALFIDTRTQRFHHPAEGEQIVSEAGLRRLEFLLAAAGPLQPLIVVVPTPLFDIGIKEGAQFRAKQARNRGEGDKSRPNFDDATQKDAESFAVYLASLFGLLTLFARKKAQPLILLCGDVHYAFEQTFEYQFSRHKVLAVQLCSSSIKNQPLGGDRDMLDAAELVPSTRPSLQVREAGGSTRALPVFVGPLEKSGAIVKSDRKLKFKQYIKLLVTLNESGDYGRYLPNNNLGEFVVDKESVWNRFHIDRVTHFRSTDFYSWRLSDWPVAPPLFEL